MGTYDLSKGFCCWFCWTSSYWTLLMADSTNVGFLQSSQHQEAKFVLRGQVSLLLRLLLQVWYCIPSHMTHSSDAVSLHVNRTSAGSSENFVVDRKISHWWFTKKYVYLSMRSPHPLCCLLLSVYIKEKSGLSKSQHCKPDLKALKRIKVFVNEQIYLNVIMFGVCETFSFAINHGKSLHHVLVWPVI